MRTASVTVLGAADQAGPSGPTTITQDRTWTVGRAVESDIVVDDSRVSRRHLVVDAAGAAWVIRDVSANGSWFDGGRIGPDGVVIPEGGAIRLRLGDSAGPELIVAGGRERGPLVGPGASETVAWPPAQPAPVQGGPNYAGPNYAGPNYAGPNHTGPNHTAPNHTAPIRAAAPAQGWPAPGPKRRRALTRRDKWIISVLLVLILGFVAADRIAASVASTTAVKEVVQRSQGLGANPTVSFGGFPFLTQVVFGKYSDIAVGINDITPPGGPRIAHVSAHLKGAHIPLSKAIHNDVKTIPVDHVIASVSIGYTDLNSFLKSQPGGLALSAGKDGAVQIAGTLNEDGQNISIAGSAKLQSDNGQLTIVPSDIHVSGTGGFDDLISSLGGLAGLLPPIPVPLPNLPFNLRITGIHSSSGGIIASAAADHVSLDAS